ncbi:MAG: hypothetical protein GX276_07380 [Clostridiaceae bacterium]|jgi:hypothetical protein|nr:hypothetical protein [Clostridiaceae bacterium]
MKRFINNQGLTLVEIIITLGLLGALIGPLMNLVVVSQIMNSAGENETRLFQVAQYYMEETRSMDEIDMELFLYNSEKNNYERYISDALDDYSIEIRLIPARYGMHYIEVDVIKDYETVYALKGSIIL